MDLTDDEVRAIRSLQRLASRWPKTLWLFSASGSLSVMRVGPTGQQMMRNGNVDQDYRVCAIEGIANDGGDW